MNTMRKWIEQYRQAKPQTRYFILNWTFYGLMLVATTIYCYARLDYVRSTRTIPPTIREVNEAQQIKAKKAS